MRNVYSNCFFLIAAVILAGCTSMRPLPLQEPSDGDTSASLRNSRGVAKTLDTASETLAVYRNKYYKTADDLRGNDYTSSDITFAGGVIGVLGGLAKSPETALAGGLLASGSSLADKRYSYKVQAENYEKGGDAIHCMYKAFELSGATNATHNSAKVLKSLNDNIDNIRQKLRKNQAQITLVTPNREELTKAFSAEKDAESTKNTILQAQKFNKEAIIRSESRKLQAETELQALRKNETMESKSLLSLSKKEKGIFLKRQNEMITEKTQEISDLQQDTSALLKEKALIDDSLIEANTNQLTTTFDSCSASF